MYTYYNGRNTAVIDEKGHQTLRTNDAFGRLAASQQYSGTFTLPVWQVTPVPVAYAGASYAYDVRDQLKDVWDTATRSGNPTDITFDVLGRKLSMVDPNMGRWTYDYDVLGNLTRQTDAYQPPRTTCFYYDGHSRLTGKYYLPGNPITPSCPSSAPSELDVVYSYDQSTYGLGHRTGMQVASGASTVWSYNDRGQVTAETKTLEGTPFTTSYTHGYDGQVQTITYPDDETVTLGYNARGLAETLASEGGSWGGSSGVRYVSAASYSAAGQLVSMTYGNGATTTLSYDPKTLRLTSIVASGVNLAYNYDPAGNVQTITDTLQTTQVTTFTYDDLNRITSARGAYTANYLYSPIGNLLTKSEGGSSVRLTYPAPGHPYAPASVNAVGYTYDNNGNLHTDGRRIMTFDAENRLSQVISGTLTTTFTYDGDGNMVMRAAPDGTKTLYVSPSFEVTVSTAAPPPLPTPLPRPGYKVYLPFVSSSVVSCSTLIDGHPIEITKYYQFGGQRVARNAACGGSVTYLYHDHLGSMVRTSDAIDDSTRYYPYGSVRSATNGGVQIDYKFTGQRQDCF